MADAASPNSDHWSTAPRVKVISLIAGIGAISVVAFLLNRETYAIGDDYHIYAFYFGLHHKGFFSAAWSFLASPFAAGRPVAIPFDLIGFSLISSLSELIWVRYFHLVLLIFIFVLLGAIARKAGLNTVLSYLIALTPFLQPGMWHLFMVTYGAGILAGMIGALLASYITMKPSLSKGDWVVFTLLAAWPIFSYQSIWPLIFLGITARLISLAIRIETSDQSGHLSLEVVHTIRVYIKCFVIVITLFVINYLIVRFGYESPRLQSESWPYKTDFLVRHSMPMTIYPWLFFWYRVNYYVSLASWISVGVFSILATVLLLRLFIRSAEAVPLFRFVGWRGVTVTILIVTALLPLSLGMYFFTDQAIAFRRVMFASIFFWFTALVMMFLLLSRLRKGYRVAIEACFAVLAFCGLFLVGLVMDTSTQQVAAREWFAAICAAKSVPLTEPILINRPSAFEANPKRFPHALANNEVQVRTLQFPAGAMLIWLSQKEVVLTSTIVTPWKIKFTDNSPLNSWDLAFARCAAQYRTKIQH